jgi:hypothetical protein
MATINKGIVRQRRKIIAAKTARMVGDDQRIL